MGFQLSASQLRNYHDRGYLCLASHFHRDEIGLLRSTAKEDRELENHTFKKSDGQGNPVSLSVWNHPGDDIYGMFARCRRVVDVAEQILGDEPYHYHSKMIMKEAGIGGAWSWHQDYGYWYHNGILRPQLTSCFIAVDAANERNGCLQIIPESHTMGRLEHRRVGQQAEVEAERMRAVLEKFRVEHVVMQPGDVLFFHPNLLHCSDANRSEVPRWSMICCYNARSNQPFKESHHPNYTPLHRVHDSAILSSGAKGFSGEGSGPGWLQKEAHQDTRTTPQRKLK